MTTDPILFQAGLWLLVHVLCLLCGFLVNEWSHVAGMRLFHGISDVVVSSGALRFSVVPVGRLYGWQIAIVAILGPGASCLVGALVALLAPGSFLPYWFLLHAVFLLPLAMDAASFSESGSGLGRLAYARPGSTADPDPFDRRRKLLCQKPNRTARASRPRNTQMGWPVTAARKGPPIMPATTATAHTVNKMRRSRLSEIFMMRSVRDRVHDVTQAGRSPRRPSYASCDQRQSIHDFQFCYGPSTFWSRTFPLAVQLGAAFAQVGHLFPCCFDAFRGNLGEQQCRAIPRGSEQ